MKRIGLSVAALLVFSICSLGQTSPMVWTKPTGGRNYQLFSIKQPSGEFIGICRAAYQGGVYPGKLVKGKCSIGFGGKEVVLSDFEIFEQDANPNIRIDDSWYKEVGKERFEIGYEKDGKKIFLCKAVYQNTLQPGKSIDGKCVFMWNGTEMQTPNYLDYFYETKSAPSAVPPPTPAYRPSNPAPVYQPKPVTSPTPTLTEAERAKRAENFFNSAIYNFRGNKFEAAAQDFTEYLKLYPNNANVYFNRGVAYQRAGKNEAAKADFEKALQLKPDFPAAKAELEKLKTTPNSESVSSIAQVKDVKPTDEFYRDLQSLIERYGISALTVDYQYNPKQSLTLLEYTKFIGQAKETLKNAASAFGLKKIDEEKLFNSKCTFSGSYVTSIPETEIAKSLSCIFRIEKLEIPATGAMTTRGRFATFLNTALERASLKITLDRQAENVTGNLFSGQTAQPAKSSPSTDWTKFLKTGTERMNAKDYDGAIKAYTQCLNAEKVLWCYKSRGTAYGLKKQYQLALADFDEVIKINAENAENFSTRALLRMETGDIFGALSDVEKAVELEPQNPQMYLNRAAIFCRIKEYRIFVKQDEDKARELGGKVLKPCK